MNSFFQFVISSSFKTLPDGRCVLLNPEFDKRTYLIIPDPVLEKTLKLKVFWINLFALFIGLGSIFIFDYLDSNLFIVCLCVFLWHTGTLLTQKLVVRKDTSNLEKINVNQETFYFFDNFTNKTQVGKNKIPANYKISKYLDVPENNDKILLLTYDNLSPIVLRCALGGWIIWQSEIKSKPDNLSGNIEWSNDKILFSNGVNFSVLLDSNTGSIVE